jgi:hypothetical protein
MLVDRGFEVNKTDIDHCSLLQQAAFIKMISVFNVLLENRADCNTANIWNIHSLQEIVLLEGSPRRRLLEVRFYLISILWIASGPCCR